MKKILALVIAAVMLCTLLSGCGAKSEINPQTGSKNAVPSNESGSQEPADEPAEPENIDPAVSGGTAVTISDAYTRFNDMKYIVYERISNGLSESPDAGLAVMELIGLPFLDLMLIPVALMGMEEVSVASGLSFINATDINYKKNGNDYTLSYKDSEGVVWDFSMKSSIQNKDWVQCEMKGQDSDSLYFEYVKTSYGYAAQYYSKSQEDGSTMLYALSVGENHDGVIGLSTTSAQPLTMNADMPADFPLQCESWYSVQGDKGEAKTADGTTLTFTAPPYQG